MKRVVAISVVGIIASVTITLVALIFDDGDRGRIDSPSANGIGGAIGDVYRQARRGSQPAARVAAASITRIRTGRSSSQGDSALAKRASRSGDDTSAFSRVDSPRLANAGPGQGSGAGGAIGNEPSGEGVGVSPTDPPAGAARDVDAVANAIPVGGEIIGGVASQAGAAATVAGNAPVEPLNEAGDTVEGIAQSGQEAAAGVQNNAAAAAEGIGSGLP